MEIRFFVDDGDKHDLRVAEILERYGFSGTFYIAPCNPNVKLLEPYEIYELSRKHEIGGHGLSHTVLTKFDNGDRFDDIVDGKEYLEEIIAKPVTSFAVPRGWYNDAVIETVKQVGFREMRTMKQGATELPKDSFVVPITVHFHPSHYAVWKEKFEEAKSKGDKGYFGVTCHGWELERFKLWGEYEQMVKYIYENKIT